MSIYKTIHHNSIIEFLKFPTFVLYSSSYTSCLSVLFNSAAYEILYADDNQLLLSFSALDVSHNIIHLENTIANVSNWMSSNFHSLNPTRPEFLIFGQPQQLFKNNNRTLSSISIEVMAYC